MITYLVL